MAKAQRGKTSHRSAVAARHFLNGVPAATFTPSSFASSENQTRRQTLQVPFPRPGESLVEIVDIEYKVTFGRCICAKISNVSIATNLHAQARLRQSGQISSHERCGSSEEGKRTCCHSPHLQWHELANAVGICRYNRINWIAPCFFWSPISVSRASYFVAQAPTDCPPLIQRQHIP